MGLLDQIRNAQRPSPVTEDLKLVQSVIIQNDGFHEYVLTSKKIIINNVFPH